jgi:8-oxo-dGTP pyrophosphatase MutT (NUDIX family)
VIERDGQVPLLRNERDEWELPGGRLEAGETLQAAVEREVSEELGLTVTCGALVDAWTYRPAGEAATVVIVVYACELHGSDELTRSDEHSDARWFDVGSVGALTMPAPYKRSIALAVG